VKETSNMSKAHEMRDSLAVPVRRLSWSISVNFVAIYSVLQLQIAKNTKTPDFAGSRSSKLTPLKSLSLLLVMISSMYVPICNRFHATQTNSGKITTFRDMFLVQ